MCKAILAEFQQEYLICTTELVDGRCRVQIPVGECGGGSGSSSDSHIFNHSKLRRRIEKGNLGLQTSETTWTWKVKSIQFPVG